MGDGSATSCEAPGCSDPYAGYPIDWTFKNSSRDRDPAFVRETRSFMPACNPTPGSTSCVGRIENTFTGQGLEFAHQTIEDYKRAPSPFDIDEHTPFINVLITDGQTSRESSDVMAPLQSMLAEGIRTFVIGFGSDDELDRDQLEQYARWGGTDAALVVDPSREGGAERLADAMAELVGSLKLDGCCVLQDCSAEPEPETRVRSAVTDASRRGSSVTTGRSTPAQATVVRAAMAHISTVETGTSIRPSNVTTTTLARGTAATHCVSRSHQ